MPPRRYRVDNDSDGSGDDLSTIPHSLIHNHDPNPPTPRPLSKKARRDAKLKEERQKKRIKLLGDTCDILAAYIMEEFKMAMMSPRHGPVRRGEVMNPKYIQKKTTQDFLENYAFFEKLHVTTRTWVILAGTNKLFHQAVRRAYEQLLKFIFEHNNALDRVGYSLQHPMYFVKEYLLHFSQFQKDTSCHPDDVKLLWAPTVNRHMDFGFTNRWNMKAAVPYPALPPSVKLRSVFSYLNACYDINCKICQGIARTRLLYGNNMHGWRICRTCKRNKFVEISTMCTRFGVYDLMKMKEYKDGTIKICPIYNPSLNDVLYIDPSASMLKPNRRMFLVYVDSLKEAFGG